MSKLQFLFATFLVLAFFLLSVHGQGVGHGQICNMSSPCRSDFDCVSGRCTCIHPRHQNYDNIIDRCVSLVFAPCTGIIDGEIVDIPCVSNAECRNETGFPECMCRNGTRQSGRNCRAEFGQPCNFTSDCFSSTSSSSNVMICKNGRCDCRNLETFHAATNRCLGLVGEFCGTGYVCVEGAACDRFDSFDGTCRCTAAFTQTSDRRCSSSQCPGL